MTFISIMDNKNRTNIILDIFQEICKIPHPSGHEEAIGEYLMEFAKQHNLKAKQDKVGNVLICKPASVGYKDRPTVILQSHQDMVCEKDATLDHDFMTQPLETYIEDGWLKAKGTTLGADDGIGVAMTLAILADNEIKHGPIEALFTVSEETGLAGASNLEKDMINGSMLINLDSEDEGEIFIGCAGGINSTIEFNYSKEDVPDNYFFIKLSVDRLHGGHSGDDIDKGFANANKILARFIYNSLKKYDIKLCSFNGGNLHNAIPRDATAVIAIPNNHKEDIRVDYNIYASDVQAEYHITEPEMEFTMESTEKQTTCIDIKTAKNFIYAVHAVVNGVYAMSMDMPGLVETSSNLASVRTSESTIKIIASHRSSVMSALHSVRDTVAATFLLAGADVKHNEGYPGWKPNPQSPLLKTATETYKELFGKEPKVRAIHAGLECGLFLSEHPHLDMISVGPTLRGVHSPSERLLIETVNPVYTHLLTILERIPVK